MSIGLCNSDQTKQSKREGTKEGLREQDIGNVLKIFVGPNLPNMPRPLLSSTTWMDRPWGRKSLFIVVLFSVDQCKPDIIQTRDAVRHCRMIERTNVQIICFDKHSTASKLGSIGRICFSPIQNYPVLLQARANLSL